MWDFLAPPARDAREGPVAPQPLVASPSASPAEDLHTGTGQFLEGSVLSEGYREMEVYRQRAEQQEARLLEIEQRLRSIGVDPGE